MVQAGERSRADLVVVGGGPTGIAALFQAGLEGMRAVGLEAGPSPMTSVRDYLNGLVLISRPTDYEVAGIPLDCRDPSQLTREEVLHYLGRVVNYGRLDIRYREPCLELTPSPGGVTVRTAVRTWEAPNVVVTAWYRRRGLPASLVNPTSGVEVVEVLHDAIAVVGRRTVILGGGLSAFEHATAVMMHGQPVTIVSRHPLPVAFRTPHFERLVRATGSGIVEDAVDLRLGDGALLYREGGQGPVRAIGCEVLILCLGHEVDPIVLAMLRSAAVISEEEIARVMASPTPDTMIRHGRSVPDAIQAALGAWPDLRTRLIGGVNGIRLAGGGLHIGGAHSGVRVSINTAVLAVRDAAGHPPPDYLAAPEPLPMALARWVQLPPPDAPPSLLGPLRPLRIASWTRTTMALRSRDDFEASPRPADGTVAGGGRFPYLLGPIPEDPRVAQILALSGGGSSVSDIAGKLGIPTDGPRWRRFSAVLRHLWQNNALTWLPPGTTTAAEHGGPPEQGGRGE